MEAKRTEVTQKVVTITLTEEEASILREVSGVAVYSSKASPRGVFTCENKIRSVLSELHFALGEAGIY